MTKSRYVSGGLENFDGPGTQLIYSVNLDALAKGQRMTDHHTAPTPQYQNLELAEVEHVLSTLAEEINHIATDKGFWVEKKSPEQLAEEFVGSEPRFALDLDEFKKKAAELVREARATQPRNEAEMLMLEVSELSEALEGIRHKNPPSDKIPQFNQAEEELADCVIRILDHCHAKSYRLAEAIRAKIEYNRGRPPKHGKEF